MSHIITSIVQSSANQVVVSASSGRVTLSLPQDIHTGASPTFVGLTLSGPVSGVTTLGTTSDITIATGAAGLSNLNLKTASTGYGTINVGTTALPTDFQLQYDNTLRQVTMRVAGGSAGFTLTSSGLAATLTTAAQPNITSVGNSLSVGSGSGVTTGIYLGNYASGYGGLWTTIAAPTSSNAILASNNTNTFLVAATSVFLSVGASNIVTVTSAGLSMNSLAISGVTTLAASGTVSLSGGWTQFSGTGGAPASGSGAEIRGGATPQIIGFNRTGSAYLPMAYDGTQHAFSSSGSLVGTFTSAGLTMNSLAISGVTTLGLSGAINTTASGGVMVRTGATTAAQYINLNNTSGASYFGVEDSTGATFGATAYATVLAAQTTNEIDFLTGGSLRGKITSTGLNSCAIGATTASTGAFTTLSASGAVTVTAAQIIESKASAITNSPESAGNIVVQSTDSQAADLGPQMRLSGHTGQGSGLEIYAFGTIAGRKTNSSAGNFAGYLQFSTTRADSTISEALRLDALQNATFAGSVIAGTGGQVFGGFGAGFSSTGEGIDLTSNDNASGATFAAFRRQDGTQIGSITRATTTNAVLYNTTSDARFKTNFRPWSLGDYFDHIEIGSFDWKDDNSSGHGVFAQSLYEIYPDAVTKGDDDPTTVTRQWAVDYGKLTVPLIAEVQSLRARVAYLESRLAA